MKRHNRARSEVWGNRSPETEFTPFRRLGFRIEVFEVLNEDNHCLILRQSPTVMGFSNQLPSQNTPSPTSVAPFRDRTGRENDEGMARQVCLYGPVVLSGSCKDVVPAVGIKPTGRLSLQLLYRQPPRRTGLRWHSLLLIYLLAQEGARVLLLCCEGTGVDPLAI